MTDSTKPPADEDTLPPEDIAGQDAHGDTADAAIPEIDDPKEGEINLDGVVGATGDGGEESAPADPLETLTAERDALQDKLLRALADTKNMRDRTERELANSRKYGHAGFARDLLGAVDNLARAVAALPPEAERKGLDEATGNLVIGVEMVSREIEGILSRHGISRIDAVGEAFNPDRHQAMYEKPLAECGEGIEAGQVAEIARPGWMLHDRLLTPAMVGVAAGEAGGKKKEKKAE